MLKRSAEKNYKYLTHLFVVQSILAVMKTISFLIIFLFCGLSLAGAEKEIPIVKVDSTPFSGVTLNDGVLVFTLKRKWFCKHGKSKAELIQPEQKQMLGPEEELLIYERHTKVVIRNDRKGEVTLTTTFDGRSFGSKPETKTEIIELASIEPKSE